MCIRDRLQTASSSLGWSISKTSGIASSLYQSGHITYIRTDSTRTNKKARDVIKDHIKRKFGNDFLGDGVGQGKSKKKGSVQDAHEAIRPTNPESEDIDSDKDGKLLYKLIWSRFAASQMSNSIRERRALTFSCEGMEESMYGTTSWRTHSGWEEVFIWNRPNVSSVPPNVSFDNGSVWQLDGPPEITVDFTKPPRRFSESSIIQQMKKDGIGRPSTYVSTVSKLIDRKYVKKEGSALSPTKQGRTLWLEVAPFYNRTDVYGEGLFSYKFTSSMEDNLDNIESGEAVASQKWDEFVDIFRDLHNDALEKRREKPTLRQVQFLESILSRVTREEAAEIIGKKTVSDLTGKEAREIIDGLGDSIQGKLPASERQIATIIKLLDKLNLTTEKVLSDMGLVDLNDLSGGRDGTASELIGKLIDLDRSSPATERQVSTIISMAESLEMDLANAMEIVQAESIETINKSDASTLISTLKKQINSKKRRKK